MTADAFSDLMLCAVCAVLTWRSLPAREGRAGLGLACLLIGAAALLGVFRFSAWTALSEPVKGAHAFLSNLAAVGAFPLWAYSLAHPDSPLACRLSGAAWLTLVVGGLGLGLGVLGFKAWAQVAPALSGTWVAVTVLRRARGHGLGRGAAGLGCLFAGFAAALLMPPSALALGLLSKTQLLHYGLALALPLIHGAVPRADRAV